MVHVEAVKYMERRLKCDFIENYLRFFFVSNQPIQFAHYNQMGAKNVWRIKTLHLTLNTHFYKKKWDLSLFIETFYINYVSFLIVLFSNLTKKLN